MTRGTLRGCLAVLLATGLGILAAGQVRGQGWRRWYHLPPRESPRIIGQPLHGNDPPGGMILEFHLDGRPTTVRHAVSRFRRLTELMASSAQPLPELPGAQWRLLLQGLEEAAVDDLLQNATVSLELPAERPVE